MQHQPLQNSHLGKGGDVVGEGGGPQKRVEKKKRGSAEEESPLIMLGLGDCEEQSYKPLIRYNNPLLNPGHLFEFQQQALIFKYLTAGLPVPLQLVVPIWKAVASSFGSDTGSFFKQYPSFVGFSPQEFDHKNMMEPEPGRCRRTDGKKWRCSKNVVPDQKYCERHMHRGRRRSRKLVEASQIASLSCKTSATDAERLKTVSSHNPCPKAAEPTPSSDSKNLKAISTLFQFMTPSGNTTTGHDSNTTTIGSISDNKTDVVFLGLSNSKSVVGDSVDSGNTIATDANTTSSVASLSSTTSIISTTCTDSKNDVSGSKNSVITITVAPDTATATNPFTLHSHSTGTIITTMETASNPAATNSSNNSSVDGKHDSSNCTNTKNMINGNRKGGSSNPSAGLRFSPKSVLQVLGCSGIELEPGRCRRTDGKKWRCSREVVPDQKYCLRHMHRGAKKRVEASQTVATTTSTVSASRPSAMNISNRTDSAILNTNLSISIPAWPLVTNDEEKSPTSSSDATISDSL